jgi:Ca-activated chloride channel family protein
VHVIPLARGVSLIALLYAGGQNALAVTSQGTPETFRIATEVNLVALDVAVTDRHGGFIGGLIKDNFEVIENGRPQPIILFRKEDQPVTVGLIVDSSGSMRPKRSETVAAASTFVEASNSADELFVVHFNETVSLALPSLMLFSADRAALTTALLGMPASGRTALYDALAVGLEQLNLGRNERKSLIVFSDGGDNESRHTLPQIMSLLEKSRATVYTIGLFDDSDRDRNPGVLRRLAHASGGRSFLAERLTEIPIICRNIATEIRSRYVIGYVPHTVREGEYRSVVVKVHVPGRNRLEVRTRTGFRVPRRG